MNLNDLYEMRDPRDAYQRDVDNSTSGFGKNSQAYRADGGANDERHDLDQQPTWYIRLNGKLIRDKAGNPYSFQSKAAANKAALTMQAKLFNKDKEFMLTTNPNDKPQGMAEGSQRVDSIVTDALKIMKGSGLNDAVQALKTVLGDREYNDRRGHYNFYVRQLMDMYGQQDMAEGHTEVKDKQGKVVSWKDDSEWHPAKKNKQGQPKDPRGVVTHLSDVARRKTADQQGMDEGFVGNMVNKAKGMFTKPATAPAAPAPVVPNAATQARIAAAPQGYDPNTGKPQVAMGLRPGVVKKGGTMDMTKKVTPAAKPAVAPAAPAPAQSDYSPQELAQINKDLAAMNYP